MSRYEYTATVYVIGKGAKMVESIPIFAFSSGLDVNSAWESDSVEDEQDLKQIREDSIGAGRMVMIVPVAVREQLFERGTRYTTLRIFANNNPSIDYLVTFMADVQNVEVYGYGRLPSPQFTLSPTRYNKLMQQGSHYLIPNWVSFGVKPV